jgi:uncharacterized membrane protein YdjX (TVP38/TMEM64 family)
VINSYKKTGLLLILAAIVLFVMFATDFGEKLVLSRIQKGASALKNYTVKHNVFAVLLFIMAYVSVNLWFPAAAVLTFLARFLFGTILGAIYVDTASTTGVVIAFVVSRNFAGKWIQRRWIEQLRSFNRAISKYGSEYLLGIRMIPVIPYFLVNASAGLTKVSLMTFVWVTALGSIPGILIYCYVGQQLLTIKSMGQVQTFKFIIAFVLLADFIIVAVVTRWAIIRRN